MDLLTIVVEHVYLKIELFATVLHVSKLQMCSTNELICVTDKAYFLSRSGMHVFVAI